MKALLLTSSLLCALAAVPAVAQDATAAGGGVKCDSIDAPAILAGTRVFTRLGSDLSDAGIYPQPAKINLIEGQAAVDCQIGPDGYLTQCLVESESPQGYGLGHGLAVTVLKWAHADTSIVGHQAGDWLRLSTNWKLPSSQTASN